MKEKKKQLSIGELKAKEILSADEVSRLYGLRQTLIYSLTHQRKIPHYKLPGSNLLFFRNDEVRAFITSNPVIKLKPTMNNKEE